MQVCAAKYGFIVYCQKTGLPLYQHFTGILQVPAMLIQIVFNHLIK